MTEENPSYHGIRFFETFGDFAFCVAARAVVARSRPRLADECVPRAHWMETLPLRMRRHCDNALTVARWLRAILASSG
jgi:O-acetylhomoserine (thiol)-lyase